MSTEHHHFGPSNGRPEHLDVSFEGKDVQPSPILKFMWWLGVTVVLSFVLSLGIYKGLQSYWRNTYTEPPPMRPTGMEFPPEPRLQGMPGHPTDPQQDMRDKIETDTKENDKLGWLDEKAGVAQIPVKDAMQLIVDKGLPAVKPMPEEKK
jgi:hypothetical protein